MFCFILCFGMTATPPATDGFCQEFDRLVKYELRFTQQEIDNLRRSSREDIAALKRHYRDKCRDKKSE